MEEYKFNKAIFGIILIGNIILLIGLLAQNGSEILKPYKQISCPENNYMNCEIPAYKSFTGKTEILRPGESIENHPLNQEATKNFNKTVILSLTIGLILNHFLYNKKYPFKKKIKRLKEKLGQP